MFDLIYLPEPPLVFRHDQATDDPRDGLALFGPLDQGKPYGIRAGVIGTVDGIKRFKRWVERIQRPVANDPPRIARPPFPGFEAVFGIPWVSQAAAEIVVEAHQLSKTIVLDDPHQRVFKTVDLYSSPILEFRRSEDTSLDLWFVIIPDDVYKYCRPLSTVEAHLRQAAPKEMTYRQAREFRDSPSLFRDLNEAAIPYHYEVNFHNQLKARLLEAQIPTQVIRESTIAHRDFLDHRDDPIRKLDELQSAIAWHLCTAAFYKTGGRPWKIQGVRPGVCYIGIVFKRDDRSKNPREACCAAQMFLDSGDGVVFKGNVGPWYTGRRGEFHLDRRAAKELVQVAIDTYVQKEGEPPKELFLHGKVRFGEDEWKGFGDAVSQATKVVCVRIRDERDLKLYREGNNPVLRGLAYVRDKRTAYLCTCGFTPRLRTYAGREVPKPLLIDVCRGDADMETVLGDIMGLTKLNYNACIFADGAPVTLKFADAVGEILTAGPTGDVPPLAFRHYI